MLESVVASTNRLVFCFAHSGTGPALFKRLLEKRSSLRVSTGPDRALGLRLPPGPPMNIGVTVVGEVGRRRFDERSHVVRPYPVGHP